MEEPDYSGERREGSADKVTKNGGSVEEPPDLAAGASHDSANLSLAHMGQGGNDGHDNADGKIASTTSSSSNICSSPEMVSSSLCSSMEFSLASSDDTEDNCAHLWQQDGHGIYIKVPIYGPFNETTEMVPQEAREEIDKLVAELNEVLEGDDRQRFYINGHLVGLIYNLREKLKDGADHDRKAKQKDLTDTLHEEKSGQLCNEC